MDDERLLTVDQWQAFAGSIVDYAFILLDCDHNVADWNAGAEQMLGFTKQEIIGRPGDVFFVPEDRIAGVPSQEIATALKAGKAEDERWHIRKDGSRFRASGVLTPLRDHSSEVIGFAKIMRDVTDREESREQMERSLRERTALVREIHHRVKNNLQMIVSLVRLQGDRISDARAQDAFLETQNRIQAIAAVHEGLYATQDLGTIHVGSYLRSLMRSLRESYNTTDRIELSIEVADLALDVGSAIPLALVSNELLCNALKHAFPGERHGRILVRLTYSGNQGTGLASQAQLDIEDTGVGLPANVDFRTNDSMGFDLVRILAEQLHAHVSVQSDSMGTRFRVVFPLNGGS